MILDEIEAPIRDVLCIARTEVMLIGAFARDLCLGRHVAPPRATTDVDLALSLPNWAAVDDLFRRCDLHFTARVDDLRIRHRETGIPVDIVPYGAIERPSGTLVLRNSDRVFNNAGIADARRLAMHRTIGSTDILVPPPAVMVALKLIAWGDRMASKDVQDAGHILQHFHVGDEVWDDPTLLARFAEERLTYDDAPAWLVGRRIGRELAEPARNGLRRSITRLGMANEWTRVLIGGSRDDGDADARVARADRVLAVLLEALDSPQ
jgi:predicted nucleotidyltransferase